MNRVHVLVAVGLLCVLVPLITFWDSISIFPRIYAVPTASTDARRVVLHSDPFKIGAEEYDFNDASGGSVNSDHTSHANPYPYSPWWPKFCGLVEDWTKRANATGGSDERRGDQISKMDTADVLFALDEFIGEWPPPELQYNVTKRPKPLQYDCKHERFRVFLTGEERATPRKVAWAFQFSGEFVTLDIGMHELDGVVDYFCVYESTVTHRKVRKPLFFERHKMRYRAFLDRIVHLVGDDHTAPFAAILAPQIQGGLMGLEGKDHILINRKVSKDMSDVLKGDDLFVYGDLDEIPDPEFLLHLKHCEIVPDGLPSLSNTMFFQSDFRFLFQSDHPPVPGMFPYSLKFPSIYLVKQAKALLDEGANDPPGNPRNYGFNPKYVPAIGGYHISSIAYLPSLIMKYMGTSEYGGGPPTSNMTEWYEWYRTGYFLKHHGWADRVVDPMGPRAPQVYKEHFRLPWLVEANPHSFPFLFMGEPPTALTDG